MKFPGLESGVLALPKEIVKKKARKSYGTATVYYIDDAGNIASYPVTAHIGTEQRRFPFAFAKSERLIKFRACIASKMKEAKESERITDLASVWAEFSKAAVDCSLQYGGPNAVKLEGKRKDEYLKMREQKNAERAKLAAKKAAG